MTDSDDTDERDGRDPGAWFDVATVAFELPGQAILGDLTAHLQSAIEGATPDPDEIETTLADVSVPEVGSLDVEAAVRPDAVVADEHVDAIVDAGGQAVDVAVTGSGDGAKVLVDTGGDVLEVAVESGGEAAAEATAEVLAAALDGL